MSVRKLRTYEQRAAGLSASDIKSRAETIREQVNENAKTPSPQLQGEYIGLIAECVYRTCGFRLFDVQLLAASAATLGQIVEMQTGEGKTVVTGVIAAAQTLLAPSVHVGTTNQYLAARDMADNTEMFELMGISYGLLPAENDKEESRRIYRRQIVYGPGYQYGFDYLHDQMDMRNARSHRLGRQVANRIRGLAPTTQTIQLPHHHIALIDEADSVMIDEAMTPLVISMPALNQSPDPTPYLLAKTIARDLVEGEDFTITLPEKSIEVNDQANQKTHDAIAKQRKLELLRPWRTYISNAIRADKVMRRDIDYVVVDGKVQIVDQNTGRIFEDRTWQDGLHQAVEAKEEVEIQPGRESTTQITRQRYLQMYDQIAGLTGTARSVTDEFQSVYGCNVLEIPTNRPSQRKVLPPRFFADIESKLAAIVAEVKQRHASGQPILIGTKTIAESHEAYEALSRAGFTTTVLNGVQDEEEADIVSRAGQSGVITIATNMAGRGTNIKPCPKALEAGGLHVIGYCPNDSRRIDRQLVGRAARQGQPGSAQFFVAATDSIFVDNQSPLSKQITKRVNAQGEAPNFSRGLSDLQSAIETRNCKARKDMILRDRWMDTVREAIEKQ